MVTLSACYGSTCVGTECDYIPPDSGSDTTAEDAMLLDTGSSDVMSLDAAADGSAEDAAMSGDAAADGSQQAPGSSPSS